MSAMMFWGALGLLLYGYFGYPAIMWALARWRPRPNRVDPGFRPTVSLIIAACNEREDDPGEARELLHAAYPRDRLDIVVAADGSSDATASIVTRRAAWRAPAPSTGQTGKSAAIARAVATCTSDILLFSDANTHYSPDAILKLVRHFADESVGGVSGRRSC